ncbi:MAG: amylo-alpha-1,6-glucosidase [Bacteroidales bacterium]|nr:amylo-alpha-1,6-glucosidase [Bacteroidales bacterium]
MSYINFDKNQLVNLEYSLSKELLRSNRAGSYASTTIISCNTRKYHGLLVTPQPALDNNNHVLLSSLDETVVQHDAEFNLGIHKYPGDNYNPRGHKYIRDFEAEPIPKITFRVGGVVLTKELILSQRDDRMIIKYTLVEAHSETLLRFKPFLAFRNAHQVVRANIYADTKYEAIGNGIKCRLYDGYSPLYMQFSKANEYTHVPDWYYNIEYIREHERGYDYQEDLMVPGFFEMPIKKGESILFTAALREINPTTLRRLFNNEVKRRIPRNNFENCLRNSAEQFIVRRDDRTSIIAGFPWFGTWGRDTFISLPGLLLSTGNSSMAKSVLETLLADLKGPLFPNIGTKKVKAYNSVDTSLWFFWAIKQYAERTTRKHLIWKQYGDKLKMILKGYREGTLFNIKMQDNGLIAAGIEGKALTWMDAIVDNEPVTPRIGMPVEVNALWYNAIMFSLDVASLGADDAFVEEWEPIAKMIPESFKNTFWDAEKGYLADVVNGDEKDWAVRPNQLFAVSLPYPVVNEDIQYSVLETIKQELLTPRGLRTLSPKNPDYKGNYKGTQEERDRAYHQGTVWPWLFGHFAEAYLRLYGKRGLHVIKPIFNDFENEMTEAGIGTISEVYDGDPPHKPGGAISQAWSVAGLLSVNEMIGKYENEEE